MTLVVGYLYLYIYLLSAIFYPFLVFTVPTILWYSRSRLGGNHVFSIYHSNPWCSPIYHLNHPIFVGSIHWIYDFNIRRFPEMGVAQNHPKLDYLNVESHGFGDAMGPYGIQNSRKPPDEWCVWNQYLIYDW